VHPRVAEVGLAGRDASLTGNLHQNRGYIAARRSQADATRPGHPPDTVKRLKAYLEPQATRRPDGPFRPLSHNRKKQETRRHMHPDAIDRVLRKYAKAIGLDRGYSAHSMRARSSRPPWRTAVLEMCSAPPATASEHNQAL